MSGLTVGVVSASAAILAALVVAGFALLGVRKQLEHDRKMRLFEARRAAYARLLAVSFDVVTAVQYQRIPGRDARLFQELTDMLSTQQSRNTAALAEMRLLASARVEEAGIALAEASKDVVTAGVNAIAHAASPHPLVRVVVRRIRPNPYPVAASPEVAALVLALGDATSAFLVAARTELEVPF